MRIVKLVEQEDINLINKLINLLDGGQITEAVYNICEERTEDIEDRIWDELKNNNSQYSNSDYYKDLANEYDAVDEHDMWTACLYNCDDLYMYCIADVLSLLYEKDETICLCMDNE